MDRTDVTPVSLMDNFFITLHSCKACLRSFWRQIAKLYERSHYDAVAIILSLSVMTQETCTPTESVDYTAFDISGETKFQV